MRALDGYRGTIGVYNYKTGEILCAVSSPSYDPDNVPDVAGDETGAYEGVYVNRFFDVTYTPGSIFKLVTSVAAIDTISDIYQQTFTCTGRQIIGGQEVICSGVHGEINFSEGLAHSCNIVFGSIAEQLGAKTLERYARRLGLGESFDCAGYHTKAGCVDLSNADDGDTAWAGIGQYSIAVNPYAYMRFMGILGGGGEAAEPYLVQSITEGDKTLYSAQRTSTGQLASSTAAEKMATMMHYNVVTVYGTGAFPAVLRLREIRHGGAGGQARPRDVRWLYQRRRLSAGVRGICGERGRGQRRRRSHGGAGPERLCGSNAEIVWKRLDIRRFIVYE